MTAVLLPVLGIDPGATCGGAALLDPDGRTVSNALFVPPAGRLNPQSVIPLAESAGFMLGALCGRARRTLRPRAVEWRHEVLGLSPRTKADIAEAVAVRMGQAAFDGLGALADVGHVVEAAWMARFGWAQQKRVAA